MNSIDLTHDNVGSHRVVVILRAVDDPAMTADGLADILDSQRLVTSVVYLLRSGIRNGHQVLASLPL